MNREQAGRQIRKLLRERRMFGVASNHLAWYSKSILIAADPLEAAWKQLPGGGVIISPSGHSTDPEGHGQEVDVVQWRFRIQVLVSNMNDQFGQAALIGAGKDAALDSSKGMGLDTMLCEARAALASMLPSTQGVTIAGAAADGAGVLTDGERISLAYSEFTVEVMGTGTPYFHQPENLRVSALTAGNYLNWSLPPDRFDLLSLRLCKVAGATPTTDPTVGVVTTWSLPYSGLPTSYTDTPGTGYSYSLFALYDARNDVPVAPFNKYSEPATVSV